MDDRDLIWALNDEFGTLTFCGGDSRKSDAELALAFVRFVETLPDTRIHPDDIEENMNADVEKDPFWSALALEYVFSDHSSEDHIEVIVDFYATLTDAQRARAWGHIWRLIAGPSTSPQAPHIEALVTAVAERANRT
jgi:hypothetical protein